MFEVGRRGTSICSLLPFISHWPKLGHIAHLLANHWTSGTATARMGLNEIWFIQLLEPWLPEQNCSSVSFEEGDIAVGQATNSICPKMQYPQAFERSLSQDHYSAGCSRPFFDLKGIDPFPGGYSSKYQTCLAVWSVCTVLPGSHSNTPCDQSATGAHKNSFCSSDPDPSSMVTS